jgi:hypothetical protein
MHDKVLKWWRNLPGFSQRFTGTATSDGRTMIGLAELSNNGVTWERDLEVTFTRG